LQHSSTSKLGVQQGLVVGIVSNVVESDGGQQVVGNTKRVHQRQRMRIKFLQQSIDLGLELLGLRRGNQSISKKGAISSDSPQSIKSAQGVEDRVQRLVCRLEVKNEAFKDASFNVSATAFGGNVTAFVPGFLAYNDERIKIKAYCSSL
jgi:hypothetical protein